MINRLYRKELYYPTIIYLTKARGDDTEKDYDLAVFKNG